MPIQADGKQQLEVIATSRAVEVVEAVREAVEAVEEVVVEVSYTLCITVEQADH
jgi:hypothetical protein